ncbi:MAG: D-alanyl-D-alanine carboxypeptidase family protein [Caldicoprobacterales bacterium]
MDKLRNMQKQISIAFIMLLVTVFFTVNAVTLVSVSAAALDDNNEEDSETIDIPEDNTDSDSDLDSETSNETDQYQFNSIAKSAVLMEVSSGKILYEKEADLPLPPASITKVMTLLLAFEAIERGDVSWDDMVTISERAWQKEGSTMFLEVGMQVHLEDIIKGISIVSANDGCVALAEFISGSEEAFVQDMNRKAQELGLKNTKFQNPHGLPAEGHYMSARDIAILARHLIINHPKILEIESQTEFTFNGITQKNRNPLLGTIPGADGLKTGWTNEAGYCLVGTAKKDNMRLISVVMKTSDEAERLNASRELLNYGFRNYEIAEVLQKGESVGEIDVKNGKELFLPLITKDSAKLIVEKKKIDAIEKHLVLDEEIITAPVSKNQKVGKLEIRLDGELLDYVEVVTSKGVEKAGFFELLWRGIIDFFKSLF